MSDADVTPGSHSFLERERDDWQARMGKLQELREAFPAATVGKLPRSTCRACSDSSSKVCDKHSKKECGVCGNYMSTAHIHLDYVGHAEVTDRLLSVDPEWSWEPVAWTDAGLPLIAKGASGEWTLWIVLTIHGVKRLGVGTVSGGFDVEKQLIGDALRNAAMRFGVALDLWAKSELESAIDETPPPAPPDPARLRRTALANRAKALPEHEYERFKTWLSDSGFPAVPKDLDDDQCAAAEEWVTNAESAAEHDAETPPEAAESAEEPRSQPAAAESAEDPAEAAERARLDAEDARFIAAEEYTKTLSTVELLVEYGKRNVTAPRQIREQRTKLVELLAADASWQPETVG
jgi:hypothetical protein